MRRLAVALLVTLLGASSVAVSPGAATAGPATIRTDGYYYPVTPVRVLDTRDSSPLHQGGTRELDLSPFLDAPASAVVLNVTVTNATAAGFLTVYPGDVGRPQTSSINKAAGETRSNSVTVGLPAGGTKLAVYNQAGDTDVIVDLLGSYSSTAPRPTRGAEYHALAPTRVFDSRQDGGPLGAGESVELGGTFPDNAGLGNNYDQIRAIAVTLTAVDPRGPGYLKAWDGGVEPFVSSVNFRAGQTVPNFAVVPVTCADDDCEDVSFVVSNNVSAATDVLVDVVGIYVATRQGRIYQPTTPYRAFDTRDTGILGPDQTFSAGLRGASGSAANLNVTAIDPSTSTFLTVYPAHGAARPGTSNLNPVPGEIAANAVQTELTNSDFTVYNSQGFIDVAVDVQGYFVNDETAPGATSAAPQADTTRPMFTARRR